MAYASKDKLTPKQETFCVEYLVDGNATRAYRVAYPNARSENSINSCASKLLRNPKVEKYIAERRDRQTIRTNIRADDVVRGFYNIASANVCLLLKHAENGGKLIIRDLTEIPESLQMAIASVKQNKYGEIEVKLCDKVKALEALGRMQGLFSDNINLKAKIEEDITIKNPYEGLTTEELKRLAGVENV